MELQLLTLDYINATDEQIAEVLDATESGAECAVEEILQRPQNPNALYKWYDSDGKLRVISPLELAAQRNDVQLMRLLLSANANVETQASKVTLLEAAEASHTKTDAKAEGNWSHNNIEVRTATEDNHVEVSKVLLQPKAD